MPSPFPGMDPYLEQPEFWPEFHNNLAAEIQGYLNQRIRPRYVARQVPIIEASIPLEYEIQLFSVEIRAAGSRELVTAIEILSPVNKRPGHEAHRDYHRKRRALLRSDANLLEIDLLRTGERPPVDPCRLRHRTTWS